MREGEKSVPTLEKPKDPLDDLKQRYYDDHADNPFVTDEEATLWAKEQLNDERNMIPENSPKTV